VRAQTPLQQEDALQQDHIDILEVVFATARLQCRLVDVVRGHVVRAPVAQRQHQVGEQLVKADCVAIEMFAWLMIRESLLRQPQPAVDVDDGRSQTQRTQSRIEACCSKPDSPLQLAFATGTTAAAGSAAASSVRR